MRKIYFAFISLVLLWMLFPAAYGQEAYDPSAHQENEIKEERITEKSNPVDLVKKVYTKANDDRGSRVQKTAMDNVNSKYCNELYLESNFTLARTLCSIKYSIRGYLQYITYIWLTAATIFIIRNWFKIVTATDKDGQIKKFKQNMINLIIWVVLLTSFYFILEAFVSVVNFLASD